MKAKLIAEGKEFPIEILDPELQKMLVPQKKTGYERVSERQMYWLQDIVDSIIIHYCPHCGKSYYAEQYSDRTLLGWTPIYKDGVLMNHDPNVTTTYCLCLSCGKSFSFKE